MLFRSPYKAVHFQFVALAMLALLYSACTPSTTTTTATLPARRPADFEIKFHESGGPDDPVSDYQVGPQEAGMKQIINGKEQSWVVTTDTNALNDLYAAVKESDILNLTSQKEEGKNANRFGYTLEIVYNGNHFSVTDQGDTYIQQEADYSRFMDVIAVVREFVGKGLQSQMIPVAVELVLDPKSPKPEVLSVDLEETNLIANSEEIQPGDTLLGETKPLKGTYTLKATAKVDGKDWTWSKAVDLIPGPSHTMLLLSKDGFKEAH
jgi:hypothetical protein